MARQSREITPFQKFTKAVDALMRVPHSEIKKALDQEKQERAKRRVAKRQHASDRAASGEN